MDGSGELNSLTRAESQRQVLLCLVKHDEPMSSREVAEELGLTVNAVNIALFNLHNKGLVDRISRGIYRYKLGPILSVLLADLLER